MQTADFHFDLPPELIAQTPAPERDQSRLLVLDRSNGKTTHRGFREFPGLLTPGDILVLNDSRVIPARLRAANFRTGGHFEILLLEENATNDWWAMLRPGRRGTKGTEMILLDAQGKNTAVAATVIDANDEGHRRLRFHGVPDVRGLLELIGETPLPPYIQRPAPAARAADQARYQTVYAAPPGSVAAPTAGLHFTEKILEEIRALGVHICFVTLHVGPGTFAPVKTEDPAAHVLHEERYEVGEAAACAVNAALAAGRRVVAVGTTTVRVLETVASANDGRLVSGAGRTRIFIRPPRDFRVVGALLTNFHLPCSSLLMLVSAFAAPGESRGRDLVLAAYAEAIRQKYRFFSYGDAMAII
jgi:S-adenosylmethionine:tRNA ribosyltransferase-isomerase